MLPHKEIVLPEVDLSHDEGDPRWHEAGGQHSVPIRWHDDGTPSLYRWTGLEPGHYREYWQLCVVESWTETVTRFEANPDDAHDAWWYVDTHPAFWRFTRERSGDYPANHVSRLEHEGTLRQGWPDIVPHKICPETNCIEDEDERNTAIQWWYEFGPWSLHPDEHGAHIPVHDYLLDGGADTYEEAIIAVAKKIHQHYGNDRRVVDSEKWRKGGGDG